MSSRAVTTLSQRETCEQSLGRRIEEVAANLPRHSSIRDSFLAALTDLLIYLTSRGVRFGHLPSAEPARHPSASSSHDFLARYRHEISGVAVAACLALQDEIQLFEGQLPAPSREHSTFVSASRDMRATLRSFIVMGSRRGGESHG